MKNVIRTILRENLGKMHYIGQCNILRMDSPDNEQKWQEMMAHKKPISFGRFVSNVDMSPLIDSGETPEGYINDAKRSDSSTQAFVSIWGRHKCMFLQSAGFEFIFV